MILEKLIKDGKCSTHPHNVFLEFASGTWINWYNIFIIQNYLYFLFYYFRNFFEKQKKLFLFNVANIIFILSPILIIFPFLPSGSFFNN